MQSDIENINWDDILVDNLEKLDNLTLLNLLLFCDEIEKKNIPSSLEFESWTDKLIRECMNRKIVEENDETI
jgi:hypothetical protein